MTDPRITVCAKALKLKAREIGLPVALTAEGEDARGVYRDMNAQAIKEIG